MPCPLMVQLNPILLSAFINADLYTTTCANSLGEWNAIFAAALPSGTEVVITATDAAVNESVPKLATVP